MIYINEFLKGATSFKISATGDKITDQNGNIRTPELTTTSNLTEFNSTIFYEKRGNDLYVECLNKSAEQIIEFIKRYNLHE